MVCISSFIKQILIVKKEIAVGRNNWNQFENWRFSFFGKHLHAFTYSVQLIMRFYGHWTMRKTTILKLMRNCTTRIPHSIIMYNTFNNNKWWASKKLITFCVLIHMMFIQRQQTIQIVWGFLQLSQHFFRRK